MVCSFVVMQGDALVKFHESWKILGQFLKNRIEHLQRWFLQPSCYLRKSSETRVVKCAAVLFADGFTHWTCRTTNWPSWRRRSDAWRPWKTWYCITTAWPNCRRPLATSICSRSWMLETTNWRNSLRIWENGVLSKCCYCLEINCRRCRRRFDSCQCYTPSTSQVR